MCDRVAFSVNRCTVSPSFKWHPGCSTRVEYLKSTCASHFCSYQGSLCPLHPVHLKIFLCQIFYEDVRISRARNFPRAYTTREKYFSSENAWICNCCVYIVGVFHCLVLRLAMWHSCVFSQQMHSLALFQMTSPVFNACKIPEECVRVTFLLISSSLRPLHPVSFWNILSSDFVLRGTYFTRSKLFSRVYHAWKIFLFRNCVDV